MPLAPLPQESWSRRHANHLLMRAGFGGTPAQREALFRLGESEGIEAAVDSLLATTENWSSLPWPTWALSETDPNGESYGGQALRQRSFEAWYYSLLAKGQPIAGKLIKFFADHFPADSRTVGQYFRFIGFFRYFEDFRRHAAGNVDGTGRYGNFKKVVADVSWSIAMIRTLDLYKSTANNINENFGREFLELFTMGIGFVYTDDAPYTEADVGASTEAFTGRKIYAYNPTEDPPRDDAKSRGLPPASTYQNAGQQDTTPKAFYGSASMPDGSDIVDGDDIIELVFRTLRCAKHLSWKLWRYFASPDPSKELVEALALRFRDVHNYEIRPFLKDIFLSEEFYAESVVNAQIKDGGDTLVTLLKQLEAELPSPNAIEDIGQQLGYQILFPPSIAGWPEPEGAGNEWLSAGAMVFRMNLPSIWTHRNYDVFTVNNARNSMASYPEIDWDRIAPPELRSTESFPLLLERLCERFLPTQTLRKSQVRALYDRFAGLSDQAGPLEGVKELVRLLLALPQYQVQ